MDARPAEPLARQMLPEIWRVLKPWRRRVLLALGLLLLSKLAAVGVPGLLKAVVDALTPSAAPLAILALPAWLLLAYALLRYAATLFTELRDLVFARVGKQVLADYAERVFAHLLALSPRFHARRQTGSLLREVERGTDGLSYLLGAGLFTVLPTAVECLVVMGVLGFNYGGRYLLVIGSTLLGYASWTVWKTRARVESQREMNRHDSRAHDLLVDTLLNHDAVRAHGREAGERARYRQVLSQWVAGAVCSQRRLSDLHLGQGAVIALGVGAGMLLAAADAQAGLMSIGDLVLVNAYLIQIFLPLNTLGFVFRETRDALLNAEHLFALLRQEVEIRDSPRALPLRLKDTTLRFEHVDFGYEPQRQVVHELSLEVPHGQRYAVVGSSGSGKSTLARLLMRLYEPDAGRISIGDQALQEVTLQSLRDAIGLVPQEPLLFNDSIAYNIAYGRPEASRAEVEAAARAAQAESFIQLLPEGYETVVGERGAQLSGGERQRIAIARALLKNPPIMVLDEATSALDTRSERAIQAALDQLARQRTALVIAHRLSTIVNADQIVVMDRGRIVEQGRHAALLERGGLYAQLWALQRQEEQAQTLARRLSQQPVNLAGLLILALDSLQAQLEAQRTELFTGIDMTVARVMGDASQIARIVQLLCELALQAAPGGRMEARLSREALSSRLTLASHGHPGTPDAPPPDTLELRTLLDEAGGRLLLRRDSSASDLTVQVSFALPVLAAQVAHPSVAATADLPTPGASALQGAGPGLRGMRLMCIDDDEDALASLAALLEGEGAQVEAVGSGPEALQRLNARDSAHWPDALICDIVLGQEDGHAVARSIRSLEAQRDTPLARRLPAVALTGMAQPEDRLRALAAGFQRHLAKPVMPQELLRVLRQLVRA
ncbi:ATP-binding cassette domain-containing protein [Mitsuaria sp. WAJ17]|uniref:ATP-binding cassette domain-containing protein n=1 Tax=Mitsuaria sp. WAJ17 TaxID=2761452 RepID=UPI0016040CA3|nr:ATP-binding cassette domain-containing protein [Mitsuaria sp. WAJ17]MBB2488009.1 ATP-binding cassette domain-containing protein [Mitsuaria sp. WAJ17]